MHQSIENLTLWVPEKGGGFEIDPGQKASISLFPEARVQIKHSYPWGNKLKISPARDEPVPFFLFWRHHFWPKLA